MPCRSAIPLRVCVCGGAGGPRGLPAAPGGDAEVAAARGGGLEHCCFAEPLRVCAAALGDGAGRWPPWKESRGSCGIRVYVSVWAPLLQVFGQTVEGWTRTPCQRRGRVAALLRAACKLTFIFPANYNTGVLQFCCVVLVIRCVAFSCIPRIEVLRVTATLLPCDCMVFHSASLFHCGMRC